MVKCKNKNSKICGSLSKMPLDECSAAMGFQVSFKSVGFFFGFKSNRVFDPPRSEFRCVWHIAFIVFLKAGFQIFGTANVEMSSGCFVNENINVMEVTHRIISCLPRPGFICFADYVATVFPVPSSCFALRRAKRVRSSAPTACRGEISALPR